MCLVKLNSFDVRSSLSPYLPPMPFTGRTMIVTPLSCKILDFLYKNILGVKITVSKEQSGAPWLLLFLELNFQFKVVKRVTISFKLVSKQKNGPFLQQ